VSLIPKKENRTTEPTGSQVLHQRLPTLTVDYWVNSCSEEVILIRIPLHEFPSNVLREGLEEKKV